MGYIMPEITDKLPSVVTLGKGLALRCKHGLDAGVLAFIFATGTQISNTLPLSSFCFAHPRHPPSLSSPPHCVSSMSLGVCLVFFLLGHSPVSTNLMSSHSKLRQGDPSGGSLITASGRATRLLESGECSESAKAGESNKTMSTEAPSSMEGPAEEMTTSSGTGSFLGRTMSSFHQAANRISTLSIYALDPDPQWLERRNEMLMFAMLYMSVAALCIDASRVGFIWVRLVYSVVAAGLLLYRVMYYSRKGWLLFFIDLCFVTSEVLVIALWFIDWLPPDVLVAIYITASGPVAGASFLLNIPLTFHHAEAFESWFMHATPMWVCCTLRWAFGRLPDGYSTTELVRLGFTYFYLWWWLIYLAFLIIHPFLPQTVSESEVIMDGFLYSSIESPAARVQEKRKNYRTYVVAVVAYTCGHAVLAASGNLAAALAYQCQATQACWIMVVQIAGAVLGVQFYFNSSRQRPMPGMLIGAARMLAAWLVVAPTHLLQCS